MLILCVLVLCAIFAPLLATHDPLTPVPAEKLLPPSREHWFGTDPYGMDIFSRVLYAARIDLSVAISSVLLGILVGVPLGAFSGFVRGRFDAVMMRLTEIMQAFPQILFAMAVIAAAGQQPGQPYLDSRVSQCASVPEDGAQRNSAAEGKRFHPGGQGAGHSTLSLVGRHIIPNTLVPVFSQFSLSCAYAVQMVAGLSFIGLGVRVPQPEWGSMISRERASSSSANGGQRYSQGWQFFSRAYSLNALGHRLRQTVLRET